nr:hypothetical protein CFP56_10198 [Quercus suber]
MYSISIGTTALAHANHVLELLSISCFVPSLCGHPPIPTTMSMRLRRRATVDGSPGLDGAEPEQLPLLRVRPSLLHLFVDIHIITCLVYKPTFRSLIATPPSSPSPLPTFILPFRNLFQLSRPTRTAAKMKAITAFSVTSSLVVAMASAQYAIDPNSVANTTRDSWCTSQQAQCPLICLQTAAASGETLSNDCESSTLTYACVCSNGLSPNISEYSQTLPYFICTEWGNQCVSNCNGNTDCQSACREDHPCGALSPTRVNITSTSSMMSSTASVSGSSLAGDGATTDSNGATIYSGYAGASPTTLPAGAEPGSKAATQSPGNGAASVRAANVGRIFGMMAVLSVLVGGFAVLL